jgi:integrase
LRVLVTGSHGFERTVTFAIDDISVGQVKTVLAAVDLREQVLLHMAILSGFRAGEMLSLAAAPCGRRWLSGERRAAGQTATSSTTPKQTGQGGEVAIPPKTAELLREWMAAAVGPEPEAFVFAGERGKPVWRDTLLYDHIRPKLKPHSLERVDFQVMRARAS